MQPFSRRTHGAYRTEDEARDAGYNLGRLLNGMPLGWSMFVGRRMGAWVLFSQRNDEPFAAHQGAGEP